MSDFLELAKARYSVRKFKTDAVEEEKILAILEAGRIAPTACNYQPQKIFVVKSEEARKKLAEHCKCTFAAPVIFMIGFDDEVCAHGMIAPDFSFGNIDASIVCSSMMFEAAQLGLGTCWVGMFDSEDLKAAFGIPANIHIRALLPTGYADESFVPSANHAKRKSLEEMVKEL